MTPCLSHRRQERLGGICRSRHAIHERDRLQSRGDLFIAETLSGNIYRYACRNGRVAGRRELHGNVIEHFNPAELKDPTA